MIDWDKQPLGAVNDCELAERLDVSRQAVHQQREKRGIKSNRAELHAHLAEMPLGELPDREIAVACGVHKHTIYKARRRLGIEGYQRWRR